MLIVPGRRVSILHKMFQSVLSTVYRRPVVHGAPSTEKPSLGKAYLYIFLCIYAALAQVYAMEMEE